MTAPITAGFDGTDESLAALSWAAREAVRRGAALRIAHAWQIHPDATVDHATQEGWARDAVTKAAQEITARHPGLPVTWEAVEGPVVETLTAAEGLLVLGSRGHGAVVGFLLGSVGQQVIADAGHPVVLVRADDDPAHEAAGRDIVVGQEGEPEDSAGALEFAFRTAAARGARVRVVRAWTLPPVFAYSPGSIMLLDEAGGPEPFEQKALADAVRPWRERFPKVPVVEHIEMGSAGQVLLSAAGEAQLVVVGRRARRTAVGARIGSVAHGVLHHAPCPVAVVPHA
ncbi:universal stress protein [Streptomyces acidiscabies]|uniref:universal stress protein n=1 Tax=Streptomyces acidiscabies TaxID=42234 RepID=UPI000952F6D4|nr:universal stress protein [Streptomyces acidiscabies]